MNQEDDIRHIITTGSIRTLLQPIFVLSSGHIIGYEALSRGPHGSQLEMPVAMFAAAETANVLAELEHLCRQSALQTKARLLRPRDLLFVNIDPRVPSSGDFIPDNPALRPDTVVLELTERLADLSRLKTALAHWRRLGYRIAIDDVGSGYSGLLTLAEIRPQFIKLDMSIIRGVDQDPVRAALVRAMTQFAREVGAYVVAEGIETGKELAILQALGVDYGQGFYLARPQDKPLAHTRLRLLASR